MNRIRFQISIQYDNLLAPFFYEDGTLGERWIDSSSKVGSKARNWVGILFSCTDFLLSVPEVARIEGFTYFARLLFANLLFVSRFRSL